MPTMFTGTIRLKICEACGLRPTDFQKRHNMTFGKPDEQPIDPYVSIDVDENHLGNFVELGETEARPVQQTDKHNGIRPLMENAKLRWGDEISDSFSSRRHKENSVQPSNANSLETQGRKGLSLIRRAFADAEVPGKKSQNKFAANFQC